MLRSLCTAQSAPSTVCLLGYIATNRTCAELLEKYCE